jgi:hypothetical protein
VLVARPPVSDFTRHPTTEERARLRAEHRDVVVTLIGQYNPDAVICGSGTLRAAPIPAGSGTTSRYRLHRGGDRQANSAIYLIVVNRLRWHPATRAYVQRRTAEGKTKKAIFRCLKRAVVRETYPALRADLATNDTKAAGTKDQQTTA